MRDQGRGPLVLVVDDNDDNREIAVHALTITGFRVETAMDGEEALQKAALLKPAVIVMDLAMPGMNGWEATAALKASPELKDICVIVVTAHAMADEVARAIASGCDSFLVKPVDPLVLAATVKAATDAQMKALNRPRKPIK